MAATKRTAGVLGLLGGLLAGALIGFCLDATSDAREPYPQVEPLLTSNHTILEQPFLYPSEGRAMVTAAIVTLGVGEETGWHLHDVPLFGYVLEGELTVDYGSHGHRIYKAGDSLMEAFKSRHNGRNTGGGPMRILAVFMGAEGIANTVRTDPPQ